MNLVTFINFPRWIVSHTLNLSDINGDDTFVLSTDVAIYVCDPFTAFDRAISYIVIEDFHNYIRVRKLINKN